MKKYAWILGALVVLVLVAWGVASQLSGGVAVQTAEVTTGPIHEFVDERGVTRLPETYLITMPVNGRIAAVKVREGAPVSRGQEVAQIVPEDVSLDLRQATAAVERLEEQIKENEDVSVEKTGLRQAEEFVKSMSNTVAAAAARMTSGRAKLDYAEKDYGRVARLAATGAQTQDQLDQAVVRKVEAAVDYQQDVLVHAAMLAMQAATNLLPTMVQQYIDRKGLTGDVLVKQKAEAEVQLDRAKLTAERSTMTSPVDGVVLERFIRNERYLPAGEKLLEIGRLEDLEIEADVLSLDVVDVKVDDPVEIYGPAVGRPTARGHVTRIYPAGFTKISSLGVEQQRVKVVVKLEEKDRQRLLKDRHLEVGYRVRVKIFTDTKPDALVIPRSALFRGTNGDWQVYAVRGGRARIENVKVGLLNDELAEIVEGLRQGDRVVVAPESNLADGARVVD